MQVRHYTGYTLRIDSGSSAQCTLSACTVITCRIYTSQLTLYTYPISAAESCCGDGSAELYSRIVEVDGLTEAAGMVTVGLHRPRSIADESCAAPDDTQQISDHSGGQRKRQRLCSCTSGQSTGHLSSEDVLLMGDDFECMDSEEASKLLDDANIEYPGKLYPSRYMAAMEHCCWSAALPCTAAVWCALFRHFIVMALGSRGLQSSAADASFSHTRICPCRGHTSHMNFHDMLQAVSMQH